MRALSVACVLWCSLPCGASLSEGAGPSPLFDVPRVDNVTVDGQAGDWGDAGLSVETSASNDASQRPVEEFRPRLRLGWDERGFLLLLQVHDLHPVEAALETSLWDGDCLEVFLGVEQGDDNRWQVLVSPGVDPQHPSLRTRYLDYRRGRQWREPLSASIERSQTPDGYILELLLPWKHLPIVPHPDAEIAVQVYLDEANGQDIHRETWYPRHGAHGNPALMHRVRLLGLLRRPAMALLNADHDFLLRQRIRVAAGASLVGRAVEVSAPGHVVARAILKGRRGYSSTDLTIPMPTRGKGARQLTVTVEGDTVGQIAQPDLDAVRARKMSRAAIECRSFVFSGEQFPSCGFTRPHEADQLIGPFTARTTYYDVDYRPVTRAEQPGRYGAIIEVVPEAGQPQLRFRTLYRQPEGLDWESYELEGGVQLPNELGVDPDVAAEQSEVIGQLVKMWFGDGIRRDQRGAVLLAGLAEVKPGSGPMGVYDSVWSRDRQWWVGLKRRLYGTDSRFPSPFVSPRPIDGPPATELREGTEYEAGMLPGTVDRIDALCQRWAADSDQGFAVCLARHGVVFLHRAYGQRRGRPMAVTDKSHMASLTKLLSATLMMQLVDQGIASLDDPVSRFLPPLEGIRVERPLTIRHLYTHTSGMWDQPGDKWNDFEEVVAGYYPYLVVGDSFAYTGSGYSLGGKVLEAVSGEALPTFYRRHLLEPLGCSGTDAPSAASSTHSTPMDIARIAQMLLNQGSYGEWRFFGPETYAQMLPRRLTKELGPETSVVWGIGTYPFPERGLGKGTFGHGAASGATLRIDPENDLIIVMTRNEGGRNFDTYHSQFIQAIAEGLPGRAPR